MATALTYEEVGALYPSSTSFLSSFSLTPIGPDTLMRFSTLFVPLIPGAHPFRGALKPLT